MRRLRCRPHPSRKDIKHDARSIRSHGRRLGCRVKRFGKDDFPTDEVYGSVDRPELRLITCGGSFNYRTRHYRDNVVVFAHLI